MNPLIPALGLLLGSAVVIYIACEYFVNGVEWVGHKLSVGQKATGTILAAFGTALPESVVTFVAVAFGTTMAQKDVGIGAALGGPLALATIAYAVVGWSLFLTKRQLPAGEAARFDFGKLSRDQTWFAVIFVVKLGLGLVMFSFKPWLGIAFLGAYALYFWKEMAGGDEGEETEGEKDPLKFAPKAETPSTAMAIFQTLAASVVIFFASRLFVAQIDVLGPILHIKPQLLALLVGPIATELPETLNAIIWIRQGKVRLALANISGAMMIQATVPTAFGLFFTPWILDPSLVVAGGVTLVAVLILLLAFRSGKISRTLLSWMAAAYVAFIVILLAFHLG
jgi:cation:H+ antiporter